MAGILDLLSGNNGAASPWGMLYPSPLAVGTADDLVKTLTAAGETGLAPGTETPFGDPTKFSIAPPVTPPAPGTFGAGATPFSFAGPGSNRVMPESLAAPAPAAPVQAAPAPTPATPPATAISPVSAAPALADAPDRYVNVGNYKMPVIGAGDDAPESTAASSGPSTAAPAAAPFSIGGAGPGFGDRLNAAAQSFENSKGLIPRLFNGVTALASGHRTDAPGQAANATAQALLSMGASASDVQAAMTNPTLMQALIGQYYGKDKYSIVQTGENDQGKKFSVFNSNDATLKPIPSDSNEAGGTVAGPDGKLIQVPPGVNRKEFIKRVTETTADAATGKKTEAQAKASSFAARMEQADSVMSKLQSQGLSMMGKGLDALPGGVGNLAQSPQYQQYKQAQSSFITALLRQESGAAINKSEFDRYERELFPQPGDGPAVVQQKAAMRASAIEQMRGAAGPGYKSPAPLPSGPSGTVSIGGASIPWSVK